MEAHKQQKVKILLYYLDSNPVQIDHLPFRINYFKELKDL